MADRVWSEKDLIRRANRRLAVLQHGEEVSGNVAAAMLSPATAPTARADDFTDILSNVEIVRR